MASWPVMTVTATLENGTSPASQLVSTQTTIVADKRLVGLERWLMQCLEGWSETR